jgi:hypothetical protein
MDIYEELGVTAYINANEWYTSLVTTAGVFGKLKDRF